jgi:hypothetical protein
VEQTANRPGMKSQIRGGVEHGTKKLAFHGHTSRLFPQHLYCRFDFAQREGRKGSGRKEVLMVVLFNLQTGRLRRKKKKRRRRPGNGRKKKRKKKEGEDPINLSNVLNYN